jgi:hypothetical protein
MSRVVAARLHERGEYDPAGDRERRKEQHRRGWENVRELWDHRDQHAAALALESERGAQEMQGRLEAAEREQQFLRAQRRRAEQQQRRKRILASQGLPTR